MRDDNVVVLFDVSNDSEVANYFQMTMLWFRFQLPMPIQKQPNLHNSENLKLDNAVIEKYLLAGRYAVTLHKGSLNNIGDTIYPFYRDWLPTSGEQLGDLPCVFCYLNFEQTRHAAILPSSKLLSGS